MKREDFNRKMRNEEISTEDLFNSAFMKKYTSFSSIEEMQEELNRRWVPKVDEAKLLKNVLLEKTGFKDIEDMNKKAIDFYLKMN